MSYTSHDSEVVTLSQVVKSLSLAKELLEKVQRIFLYQEDNQNTCQGICDALGATDKAIRTLRSPERN